MKTCVSLASWPAMRHEQAARRLVETIWEPCFGRLSTEHVQLVPQSFGVLTEGLADSLLDAFPATCFRLHANVRVLASHRVADLSGFVLHRDWFEQAARISRRIAAPAYTAHPGLRAEASLTDVLENTRRCTDLFGCIVGVEGQYPVANHALLISTWHEYRQLFESGVPYAVDLSHIHILATQSGVREEGLLAEMLACERCIEVHVSDNDGSGDWHQVCQAAPWWTPLLGHINQHAVIFSEGNHRKHRSVQ